MSTALRLFVKAFNGPRDPRSPEYKAGVLSALQYRFDGKKTKSPYAPGTVQFDAWNAGLNEGHSLWRNHQRAISL